MKLHGAMALRMDRTLGRDANLLVADQPAWMNDPRLNCLRPWHRALFYSHFDKEQQRARALCGTCPFREECRDWALENGERWGMWGGFLMSSTVERAAATNERTAVAA